MIRANTFRSAVSDELAELKIKIGFTNRVISQQEANGKTHYLCVLTRIDSFTASVGDLSWAENERERGKRTKPGAWRELQAKNRQAFVVHLKDEKER